MSTQMDYSAYSLGEGKTGTGQIVNFTCPCGQTDRVRAFLQDNVRTIDTPTTGRVCISHGSYGGYTRYDVTQHNYAGGGAGYIEVLEIKNPPDQRCGIVINKHISPAGSEFMEWESLAEALIAFESYWSNPDTASEMPKFSGFKRRVVCGALTPWFYAIGNEELIGDYAFPEGLQDDPVYRFGRKFVVFDQSGLPHIKTCMGTRLRTRRSDYHPYKEESYRLIYWDDGTIWDESGRHSWWSHKFGDPRPAEEGELWITEAICQFRQFLAGESTEFTISLTDGHKFVGKLVNGKTLCAEGRYFVVTSCQGEDKPREGWVDFKPTVEAPDLLQLIVNKFKERGKIVEYLEIKDSKTAKGGKKWSGVYLKPST